MGRLLRVKLGEKLSTHILTWICQTGVNSAFQFKLNFIIVAFNNLIADDEGWNISGFRTNFTHQSRKELDALGVFIDFETAQLETWVFLNHLLKHRFGRGTVRAAITPEKVDHYRCFRLLDH